MKLTKLGSLLSESYVKACRAAAELTSKYGFSERSTAAAQEQKGMYQPRSCQCSV